MHQALTPERFVEEMDRRGIDKAVICPLGQDIDTFWNNLIAGRCGIDRITGFDVSKFDCRIAAEVREFDPTPAFPSPKEIRRTDRFAQFGVYAGYQAIRDGFISVTPLKPDLTDYAALEALERLELDVDVRPQTRRS